MASLFIFIPLGTAFLFALLAKIDERLHDACALAAGLALLVCSGIVMKTLSVPTASVIIYNLGTWAPPAGIALVIDRLSAFMLLVVSLVAFFVLLYSTGYMKEFTAKWKFYSLFFLMLTGINGVLLASDIFNLYVFMEIAALAAYFLVAFGTGAEELEASFKYAIMGTVASCFVLLGIALLYGYTGTLNMVGMAGVLAAKGPSGVLLFVAVLFMMGFGLKAALVPFHSWLAYAHSSAPAPISAMLSGVFIKVLGIYALSRIFFNVFGMIPAIAHIFIGLGVLSMIVGAILAFGQSNIKRLFAYSTVSQIGYIAVGLGLATPLSVFGALFYLLNHSLFKSLLFLNSGAIEHLRGTRDLGRMSGVIADEPITGYTNLIGALSICGIPPLGGFWSKAIIIFACIQAGHPMLGLIAALVSALTMAYYFKSITPALFGPAGDSRTIKERPTVTMNAAMGALAVLVILSALVLIGPVRTFLFDGATSVLIDGTAYAKIPQGGVQ